MHLRILRELAEEGSKPLSILFEKLCQSCEIPTEKGKHKSSFQREKEKTRPGELQDTQSQHL